LSKRNWIKKEYYIELTKESGAIVIRPGKSIYLLVPNRDDNDIAKRLKEYSVDLANSKDDFDISCSLAPGEDEVNLIYRIKRIPKMLRKERNRETLQEGEESPQTLPAVDRERWRNKKNGSSG